MNLREQFEKETGQTWHDHSGYEVNIEYMLWLENKVKTAIHDPVCKDCGDPIVSDDLKCNNCRWS